MEYQGKYYRKVMIGNNDFIYANFGTKHVIRILNIDDRVKNMAKKYSFYEIANECKYVYRSIHQEDFKVTTKSLAFEIAGHVYPNKIAKLIKEKIGVTSEFIVSHTDVIDSGEKDYDRDRGFWDSCTSHIGGLSDFQ